MKVMLSDPPTEPNSKKAWNKLSEILPSLFSARRKLDILGEEGWLHQNWIEVSVKF